MVQSCELRYLDHLDLLDHVCASPGRKINQAVMGAT